MIAYAFVRNLLKGDSGGIRLLAGSQDFCRPDARSGRRRLHRTRRTGPFHRGLWNRKNASVERTMCGGMPAKTARAIYDAAAQVNELVEAKHQLKLRRVLARWARYELIAIDEVGYVPMADMGAEFLFQVVAERAEKAAVILTTNLPFSEWTQVIPNARICKALLDRITDRAHIIETGTDSYRFRRTLELRGRHARSKATNGLIPESTQSTEKGSPPGTPVPKRDDYDDNGGSAASAVIP